MILANQLPWPFHAEVFWHKIPLFLTIGEQIFRILIFTLTLLMPLSITSKTQKTGIVIYIIGVLIYFVSWLVLIYYPHNKWSSSYSGFLSPAWTPVLWLTGIALTGDKFYFDLPCNRWIFLVASVIFLIFHNVHAVIIYYRIQ